MLNIAVRAARSAGDLILRSTDQIGQLHVDQKGKNDYASEVDRKAEREIIKIIRAAYPDHGILAEESGKHSGNEFVWIIDPLDGTTNFLHGFPQYAVSIALKYKGKLEVGVVYDPLRDELFTARKGAGAMLNNRRIRKVYFIYNKGISVFHGVNQYSRYPAKPSFAIRFIPSYEFYFIRLPIQVETTKITVSKIHKVPYDRCLAYACLSY